MMYIIQQSFELFATVFCEYQKDIADLISINFRRQVQEATVIGLDVGLMMVQSIQLPKLRRVVYA